MSEKRVQRRKELMKVICLRTIHVLDISTLIRQVTHSDANGSRHSVTEFMPPRVIILRGKGVEALNLVLF